MYVFKSSYCYPPSDSDHIFRSYILGNSIHLSLFYCYFLCCGLQKIKFNFVNISRLAVENNGRRVWKTKFRQHNCQASRRLVSVSVFFWSSVRTICEEVSGLFYVLVSVRGSKPGKNVQLTENEIKGLCIKSREIFLGQPILLELEAPLKICGMAVIGFQ